MLRAPTPHRYQDRSRQQRKAAADFTVSASVRQCTTAVMLFFFFKLHVAGLSLIIKVEDVSVRYFMSFVKGFFLLLLQIHLS